MREIEIRLVANGEDSNEFELPADELAGVLEVPEDELVEDRSRCG